VPDTSTVMMTGSSALGKVGNVDTTCALTNPVAKINTIQISLDTIIVTAWVKNICAKFTALPILASTQDEQRCSADHLRQTIIINLPGTVNSWLRCTYKLPDLDPV